MLCCASLGFISHYESGFVLFSQKASLLYSEMQEFYFFCHFLIELMLQRHLVFMTKRLSYYSFILALFERFLLLTDTVDTTGFRSFKSKIIFTV